MTTLITPTLPTPGPPEPLMTAEEFFRLQKTHHMELVRGVIKEVPMVGTEHGMICALVARLLGNHVSDHDLGRVLSNDTLVLTHRNPDGVRGMDIAYVSYGRLPKGPTSPGFLEVAPELVVEVRSPTDRWSEILVKVGEYLQAGVSVVVVLDPERRAAVVYRPDAPHETLQPADTLTAQDVLPGFAVEVRRLFG